MHYPLRYNICTCLYHSLLPCLMSLKLQGIQLNGITFVRGTQPLWSSLCSQLGAGFLSVSDYKGTFICLVFQWSDLKKQIAKFLKPLYSFVFSAPLTGQWCGVLQVRECSNTGSSDVWHTGVIRGFEQMDGEEGGINFVWLQDHGAKWVDAFQPWQTQTTTAKRPPHPTYCQGEAKCTTDFRLD